MHKADCHGCIGLVFICSHGMKEFVVRSYLAGFFRNAYLYHAMSL